MPVTPGQSTPIELLTAVPRPNTASRFPKQFPMPKVQPRQAWEDLKKAERALAPSVGKSKPVQTRQELLGYTKPCAHCGVKMGPAFVNRELYLAPKLDSRGPTGGRTLTWEVVCETCAQDDLELSSGFVLVSERDYTQAAALGVTVVVDETSIAHKMRSLERFLLPAWREHVELMRALAKRTGGAKIFNREQQFDRFVRTVSPPTKSYADLNPTRVFSRDALELRAARARKQRTVQSRTVIPFRASVTTAATRSLRVDNQRKAA